MEFETLVGDKVYRCATQNNSSCVSDTEINKEQDKTDSGDKKVNSDMKEGFSVESGDRSVCLNMDRGSSGEQAPCVDSSPDNSKEDSDFSDYSEDNNRCQLANQALRAKLLNGVLNPITGNDSKLRVSVFDHRIIPKTLIIARRNDNQVGVDTVDNLNENKVQSHSGANVNEQNNTNKRKRHNLSYAVLKANRKTSTSCDDKVADTSPNMDSDNDYRTRFDILLRNLIGDVSEMHVEPSPMTVSSGYESDYIQTQEADIDKMFNTKKKSFTENKENVSKTPASVDSNTSTFCVPVTCADIPSSSPLTDNHQFTSLPSIPTQQSEKPKIRSFEEKEISKHQRPDKDQNGFSYAQRHNYKLTKVTRSMYEIIHDLQNGDKVGPDGRKRSKKGRKTTQDGNSCSDGSSSARENTNCAGIQPDNRTNVKVTSESENATLSRTKDTTTSSVSGSVVRCVRRPFANECVFKPPQRRLSNGENNRLMSSSSNNDCDKVQNDLRNLLCDTSDVTLLSADNNERAGDLNTLSSGWALQGGLNRVVNGPTAVGCNHADSSITANTTGGQRRPTITEQFLNRHKPDDHVYETIPGDEKLYEEWKKMRANPKIPKIRRYTTVPDLPGTFIPKEPPALPARRYLNNNINNNNIGSSHKTHNTSKENDDYIFMGDINSNFPSKELPSRLHATPAESKSVVELQVFQCFPYTLHDDHVFSQPARNDETSDGYCSIDNLSLLRENVTNSPSPVHTDRDRPLPIAKTLPHPPLKRSDFFLRSQDRKQNGFNLSSSHLFTDRLPVTERRLPPTDESQSASKVSTFERDTGKPVFQATYV